MLEELLQEKMGKLGAQRLKVSNEMDEKGNLTMSLIILTASPIELAWNPILFMPLIKSSTVIGRPANLLKSNSSTFWEPSGISFEETKTASVTVEGGALCPEFAVMLDMDLW